MRGIFPTPVLFWHLWEKKIEKDFIILFSFVIDLEKEKGSALQTLRAVGGVVYR